MIGTDGRKYGPADEGQLLDWLREGRITAETELENEETGARIKAGDLPNLNQAAAEQPDNPPPFQEPPAPQSTYYRGAPAPAPEGGSEVTLSIIASLGSFFFSFMLCFCCPYANMVIFCVPLYGLNLANQAIAKGHPSGAVARAIAIICLVLGAIIGLLFLAVTIIGISSNGAAGWHPFFRLTPGR